MGRKRRNDKSERLILAADALIREKNYSSTTLADIAHRAAVPLGNVYYYFKTKDDILSTVIQHRAEKLAETLATLQAVPAGLPRLTQFLAIYQNPSSDHFHLRDIGYLCHELAKEGHTLLAKQANAALQTLLSWLVNQFKACSAQEPEQAAEHLLSTLQGAALLEQALGNTSDFYKSAALITPWLTVHDQV